MPILLAWLLLAQASPKTIRMEVTFAGNPVGESTYVSQVGGDFRSEARFSIGPTVILTTLDGGIKSDRIVRYKSFTRQGESRVVLNYSLGKLTFQKGEDKGQLDYTVPLLYAASLHPQLTARFLSGFNSLKPGDSRKYSVYFLDTGSEAPVTIQVRPPVSVQVDGKDETVRRFSLSVGPTELNYDLSAGGDVVAMDVPGQRLRFLVKGWEGLYEEADPKHPELSQPTFRTERLRNQKMKTRDGVTLVADVVRPVGRGRFPAILERTPYGRGNALSLGNWWAQRGYVYIAQDCRGRGESAGDWDPFVNEGRDGFDAIAWVAQQGWSDGNVGMIGGSYAGVVQWQAAVERPPALRCIVPQVSPPDAMRNLPYEYGTFYLQGALWWSRIVQGKQTDLSKVRMELPNPSALDRLPLRDVDRAVFGKPNEIYQSWLRRTTLDAWKGFDQQDRLPQSQVPALHVSGWFDGDGIGTKLNWESMRRAGRRDQWLVYGPWTHAFNTTTRLGDLDFGPAARFDLDGLTLRFFDTFLKRRTVGMDEMPHVQAFLMGANRWVSLDGWPSPKSTLVTRYLAPDTLATAPRGPGAVVYTYDPAKDKGEKASETTKIVLPPKGTYAFFKGEAVVQPTAIAGPFEVRLFFKSGAKDTDFFATLVDVSSDGTLRLIGIPGKLRASYRDSLTKPSLLIPGRHYTALVRPWDSAVELAPGHRLGLLLTSTMFPAYARNLGTGEPLATGRQTVPQRNVILTGTLTPSRITYRRLW